MVTEDLSIYIEDSDGIFTPLENDTIYVFNPEKSYRIAFRNNTDNFMSIDKSSINNIIPLSEDVYLDPQKTLFFDVVQPLDNPADIYVNYNVSPIPLKNRINVHHFLHENPSGFLIGYNTVSDNVSTFDGLTLYVQGYFFTNKGDADIVNLSDRVTIGINQLREIFYTIDGQTTSTHYLLLDFNEPYVFTFYIKHGSITVYCNNDYVTVIPVELNNPLNVRVGGFDGYLLFYGLFNIEHDNFTRKYINKFLLGL